MMRPKSLMNVVLTGLGLATAAGLVISTIPAQQAVGSGELGFHGSDGDEFSHLSNELVLTGIVRDFKARNENGGHPDFELSGSTEAGYGHYVGTVEQELDEDGKPVWSGGQARKISSQWRDSSGRPINPALYDPELGDQAGSWSSSTYGGWVTSAQSFSQWFRHVPGQNMASSVDITLKRVPGTNRYVFDDREDPNFPNGFFPVNGKMFGNYGNYGKNFHFTFELSTEFIYHEGQGQVFTFRGDDDVWVFINDKLVIDLGGVHSAIEQTIELDRLDNLVPDEINTLKFFFAERHTTQSNFRIETTINLRSAELPSVSAIFD